jgi:hypothetical protein
LGRPKPGTGSEDSTATFSSYTSSLGDPQCLRLSGKGGGTNPQAEKVRVPSQVSYLKPQPQPAWRLGLHVILHFLHDHRAGANRGSLSKKLPPAAPLVLQGTPQGSFQCKAGPQPPFPTLENIPEQARMCNGMEPALSCYRCFNYVGTLAPQFCGDRELHTTHSRSLGQGATGREKSSPPSKEAHTQPGLDFIHSVPHRHNKCCVFDPSRLSHC